MASTISKLILLLGILLTLVACSDSDTKVYELDTPEEDSRFVQHLTQFKYNFPSGETLHITAEYDFDIDRNISGDKWISASPCVDAETFKMIYKKNPEEASQILNQNKTIIINNIITCLQDLKIANVSNFTLEYSEVTLLE